MVAMADWAATAGSQAQVAVAQGAMVAPEALAALLPTLQLLRLRPADSYSWTTHRLVPVVASAVMPASVAMAATAQMVELEQAPG